MGSDILDAAPWATRQKGVERRRRRHRRADGFAQVFPEHKFHSSRYCRAGATSSHDGDGVNDAPALKEPMRIASREPRRSTAAADIVLMTPAVVIIDAIKRAGGSTSG